MSTAALSPFAWKDSYSVKIQSIDSQHKQLLALLAKLQDAMMKGRGRDVLGQVLDELVHYTKSHFATEERLMQSHGYPAFDAHQAIHETLTQRVMDFQSRFANGQTTMGAQILQFLNNWLVSHIMGTDMNYSEFLRAKGVR